MLAFICLLIVTVMLNAQLFLLNYMQTDGLPQVEKRAGHRCLSLEFCQSISLRVPPPPYSVAPLIFCAL